jgi:superfamily II DNA helicase RecQ
VSDHQDQGGHQKRVLIVQRTGAGKTVIIQAVGLFLKGINMIVSPLLALTTNLVSRFKSDVSIYGKVDSIHF